MTPSQLKRGDQVGPFQFCYCIYDDYAFNQLGGRSVKLTEETVQSLLTHYGGVSVSEGGTVDR